MSDSAATERPAEKKDRSHYLYMAVIAAVIAGIAVGILAPTSGRRSSRWAPALSA